MTYIRYIQYIYIHIYGQTEKSMKVNDVVRAIYILSHNFIQSTNNTVHSEETETSGLPVHHERPELPSITCLSLLTALKRTGSRQCARSMQTRLRLACVLSPAAAAPEPRREREREGGGVQ